MRFLQSFSISRVDNYDEFYYSNKLAVFSETKVTMQHLYRIPSSSTINTSATNIPAANTFQQNFALSNELQNGIAEVSVVQAPTSKTAKEFEFAKKKSIYLKPVDYVPQI
jgi:hypothetical protein